MKKLVGLALTLALSASSLFPVVANAQTPNNDLANAATRQKHIDFLETIKKDKDFKILKDDGDGNFTYTASENVKDKLKFNSKLNITAAQGGINVNKTVFGYNKLNALGSYIETSYNTSLGNSIGYAQEYVQASGRSYTSWLGSSPSNASSINFVDAFSVSGSGISSVSVPGGVNWTTSSNGCKYTYSTTNAWQLAHDYSGITIYGTNLSYYYQTTSGDYILNGGAYTSQASNSTYVRS